MNRGAARGFTLIEVLIAIAILLALMGSMYGFLFDMLSSRSRAMEFARKEQAAALLIKTLDADLTACVTGDRVSGAGIQGDETHVRVLSRGVAASLAQRREDDADIFGDLQFTEFRFDAVAGAVQMERGPVGRSGAATSDVERFTDISKVRFRFYDGHAWTRSFDSLARRGLPVAVEVAIWLRPLPGQEEPVNRFDSAEPAATAPDELGAASRPSDAIDRNEDQVAEADTTSDDPPPDRLRVFFIPDARQESDSEADHG